MEPNIVGNAAVEISPYVMLFAAAKPMILEWIKGSDMFPSVTPATKSRVLAVAAVLSAISGVLASAMNGQLDENLLNDLVVTGQNFIATFGISELFYRHVYKRFAFKAE